MVGPEGKEPAELRAEMMLVATGRAANIEDIGLETTKVETDRGVIKVNGRMRTKEPHVYAIGDAIGGLWLAHTAAHEGIIAAHTIAGDTDVHDMDYNAAAAGDLLPPGDRLDRADRGAGHGARPDRQGRQGPVPGDRQGDHRGRVRGLRQGHRRQRDQRHARRPHRRPARHGPHRRGVARLRARGDAVGDRRARPTRTRRSPRSSARPRWPSTGGRSTSRARRRPDRERRSRRPDQRDGRDPAERPASRRRRSACPTTTSSRCTGSSRSRAPSTSGCGSSTGPGRIPFVISGQGHEGAQVGIAWAFEKGHDWIAPVLPLDRDLPDLRDERARHHDRAVRDGQRPVVGRAPDARPLRQRTSTTSCRSARRSRPSCSTRSGSPWRPRSARPARSRWPAWARARPTRATSTRASTSRRSTSCRSCSSSRTTATRSACRRRCRCPWPNVADRAAGLRHPGGRRRRRRRAGLLRGGARRGRPGARGRADPTLIEAKVTRLTAHSSDDQQTKYRSAEELAAERGHDALPRFREQLRDAGVLTDEIEARLTRRDQGRRRGRHRLRRGRARPGSRDRDALRLRTSDRAGRGVG